MRFDWVIKCLLGTGVCGVCAACSSAESSDTPVTETVAQPILGNTYFPGCTEPEQHAIRHAFLLERAYATSERFSRCMWRADYVPCFVSPFKTDPMTENHPIDEAIAIARDA